MARPLYASFLPTIKCSNCAAEIEISAMGDHFCTGNPDDVQPQMGRTDHDRIPASYLVPSRQPSRPPFPVDRRPNLLSVPANGIESAHRPSNDLRNPERSQLANRVLGEEAFAVGKSPITRRAVPPARSMTGPVPTLSSLSTSRGPPSVNGAGLTVRNGSAPPDLPDRLVVTRSSHSESAPTSPLGRAGSSALGGANLLKRMDSIAPGPFNSRSRKDGDKSTSSSSLIHDAPEHGTLETGPRSYPLPAALAIARPPSQRADDPLQEQAENTKSGPSPTMNAAQLPSSSGLPNLRTSDLSWNETSASENSEVERVSLSPALTQSTRGHSLSESESSVSQSEFDSRTASSRSSRSPLTSNASADLSHNTSIYSDPGKESTRVPSALDDTLSARFGTAVIADRSTATPVIESVSPEAAPSSTSKAIHVDNDIADHKPPSPGTHIEQKSEMPALQVSPAAEQHLSSLKYDPSVIEGRASSASSIAPLRQLEAKRRPATPKPTCRGCCKQIVGKSIKAADGSLTGRWHRECFTCHTCKEEFQTADFYVLNDQPYCAHHYHVLNRSICRSCNTGIEGQYLETQSSQKFHSKCFACHDCHKPLTKDYFEMNNQFFCETDAYRAWQKSKMLTPGRRFPERRQTRLMNMS